MKIALISDIHGDLVAMRKVLADAATRGADEVICLGDVATIGPDPAGVVDLLRELGCVCIMGNHDSFMLDPSLVHAYTKAPFIIDAVRHTRQQLDDGHIALIRSFLSSTIVALAGGRTLLLYHGSPRSNTEDLLPTTPADEVDTMLGIADGGARPDLAAGGHTHIQMLRQHRGTLLINPGSVSLPFYEFVGGAKPDVLPHSEYAIVHAQPDSVSVELVRV